MFHLFFAPAIFIFRPKIYCVWEKSYNLCGVFFPNLHIIYVTLRYDSSVGSASAYQSVGSGFEPRLRLIFFDKAENIPVFSGRLVIYFTLYGVSENAISLVPF